MPATKSKPSDVRRDLRLTSPLTSGPDVRALQVKLKVPADGQYGPVTSAAADRRARALGALESTIAGPACTQGMQHLIREPARYQTPAQKKRADARAKAVKKSGKGGQAALAWAHSKIGIKEHPAGSNSGPEIDAWARIVGIHRAPWCGAFAVASALAGGVRVTSDTRYTPWIEGHARAHTGGYEGWADVSNLAQLVEFAHAGDHIVFDFNGGGADHVGVLDHFFKKGNALWVVTVDGNTGIGNDANGGMVMERERQVRGVVMGAAKVRWA